MHSLEVMHIALNDSRLAFFNRGVTPKNRADNMIAYRIACGLTGLLHDVGKLDDMIIVTVIRDEEHETDVEVQYYCVEPLVEFLSHTHNIPVEQIYALGDKGPRYFIKGWKKGRSSHHDAISPFLMRSFVSKSALKLISRSGDELLSDFMTSPDWAVLTGDVKNNRVNIIHDIWSNADQTSSINDKRKSSLNAVTPITGNLEIKTAIIRAMQEMCNNAQIAIDKADDNCYVYTHASDKAQTFKFFITIRFDERSEIFIKQIILLANNIYKFEDVLSGNEPSLENIYTLFKECDLIVTSGSNGIFSLRPEMLKGSRSDGFFDAIVLRSWHDMLLPSSLMYDQNRDSFEMLKCTFKDKEPSLPKSISESGTKIDTSAHIEYEGRLYTVQELKDNNLYDKVFPQKNVKTDNDEASDFDEAEEFRRFYRDTRSKP